MEEKILRRNIADNMRLLRAKKRISQEALSEKSNTTQQYISSIENEMVNPSIEIIVNIAEALEVTVNDLIY